MKRERILFCASLTIILIISNSTFGYYNIIDLGSLGGSKSGAYSVNDSGQIVGYSYDSSGNTHACIFDSTGDSNKHIDLGSGCAYSNNNKGVIVGTSTGHACIFDSTGNGANINLGGNTAYSINDSNQIVGWTSGPDITKACLFDSNGNGNNMILASVSSKAYSINNSGQIVGWVTKGSQRYACLFNPGQGYTTLYSPSTSDVNSIAMAINDIGQVVGFIYKSLEVDSERAYLFTEGPDYYLGPGSPMSINNKGQIVGYYTDWLHPSACLFDPNEHSNIDLESLIDPSLGWVLNYAYDINNDGWIVGQGVHNGQTRAYLLAIPEPMTITLLSFGVLVLQGKKKTCLRGYRACFSTSLR
jgi:probable HAF family extracellular repeat protein